MAEEPSFKARPFLETPVSPGRIRLSLQHLAMLGIFCASLLLSLIIMSPHKDIHSVRAGMASPVLILSRPPVTLPK